MGEQVETVEANVSKKLPAFVLSDIYWLFAIAFVVATTGIWSWLAPRPEIGKVAILWLPSAVLLVAILRNWGRKTFCFLAIAVFYIVAMPSSFSNNSQLSAFSLLSADVIEVFILAFGLSRWAGPSFRLTSALNVAVFGGLAVLACATSGIIAALVSQIQVGPKPIGVEAPLQVGVAWFTANLATYMLVAAPLIALTGRESHKAWTDLKQSPLLYLFGALSVMSLTFIGYILPQWLAAKTGLALGSGGLILIAFPLAAYLAITRGPVIAALTGAAVGIPAIYATMAGFGPFGRGNASANVFDMQATLIVSVFTLLLIGAMSQQLRDRSRSLEKALDDAINLRGNAS
jgi:hypothetical protein